MNRKDSREGWGMNSSMWCALHKVQQMSWKQILSTIPSSRRVGLLAVAITTSIMLGCMSLSFGGKYSGCSCHSNENGPCSCKSGVLIQAGTLDLRSPSIQTIYYPIPYQGPPNLTLTSAVEDYEIVEQQADHFCVKMKQGMGPLSWKARGIRTPTSLPPVQFPAPLPNPNQQEPARLPELQAPTPLPATNGQQ